MTAPLGANTTRDSAVHQIDDTTRRLNLITGGQYVAEEIAVGVLTAQAHLAIATSLLAVVDAIRSTQPDGSR